ncbi:hypothetical protein STSP1_01504 [Sedimentisphaera salicampi]|uniref:Sulfatase N-terminal domain-containing protein n=2 Tax=Sedimentisphaera salicampi TaxID=1941349 RepID=A0A1W6LMV7_9BACT|nr:hypothetical protein STSP1_01504 [Sedimentisphaera salicampi]
MQVRELRVLEEKWDYLIILDACRYDYFEKYYKFFLPGELEKRRTPASNTPRWRDANFPDYYEDVVYISASPMMSTEGEVYGYNAKDHFRHIHEVWKELWDNNLGTVAPIPLVNKALEIIGDYSGKKFIIHLLQPHAPYIFSGVRGYSSGDLSGKRKMLESENYSENKFLRRFFEKNKFKLRKLIRGHNQPDWVLRKILGLAPSGAMEAMWRKGGTQTLRNEYEKNLIAALASVRIFAEKAEGETLVIADHGELLGENGMYGHPEDSGSEILMNVPCLKINSKELKKEGDSSQAEEDDQQTVADKLGQLGYM